MRRLVRNKNLVHAVKKFLNFQMQISFQRMVTIIYVGLALTQIGLHSEVYSRWLSLNGKILYPFLPDFVLNHYVYIMTKWVFLVVSLVVPFSTRIRTLSVVIFISGFFYFLLNYAAGAQDHQNHLPVLVLFLLALHFNFPRFFKQEQVITAIRVAFCLVFLTAGLAKLKYLNFLWFDQELHLKFLLKNRFLFHSENIIPFIDMNKFVILNFSWFKWMFFGLLPIELTLWLALLPRFRFLIWIIALFQILASQLIYAAFYSYAPLYSVWLLIRTDSESQIKITT